MSLRLSGSLTAHQPAEFGDGAVGFLRVDGQFAKCSRLSGAGLYKLQSRQVLFGRLGSRQKLSVANSLPRTTSTASRDKPQNPTTTLNRIP